MKQFKSYFFAVIFAAVTLSSCSKDSATGTTTYPSGQGELVGTGGASFSVTGMNAVFNKQTTGGVSSINIIGNLGTSKQFIIGLSNITSTGTYSLVTGAVANSTLILTYVAGTAGTDNYFSSASGATAGSITITTLSATSIEGTYTTKVSNTNSVGVSISGTFKGNF
jgi:hypothetical protein